MGWVVKSVPSAIQLAILQFSGTTAMKSKRRAARTIDAYIAGFPADVQTVLERIRATIHKAAPGAEEKISYQIPAFTLDGKYLIYFAAFQKHIGLYPAPRSSEEFKAELARYAGGKGTVQFPLDRPIPLGLIRRIVKFRIKDNRARAAAKAKR
jgi:uncharacterized protein YdhG (YjbR/CyaY superfamily)